jgi:starch-binding outer membrane protein, SusD/RagB family
MKIKLIYFMATILIFFASCKKYLESDSPSTLTSDYIFSREDDVFKAVEGIYALMTTDYGYSIRLSFYYTVNTDVEMIVGASDGGRRDIAEFNCNTTNSEILNPWNNAYTAIDRANQCIKGIKASTLWKTNDNVMQMYAESVALRALFYYELVRNWGDVPYKTTPTVAGENYYLPRTDRDTILTHCINDLIAVEPLMYRADEMDEGIERINKEFVEGLIARIALARGGYSLRWENSSMVMKRNSDYLDYYKIANTYCKTLRDNGGHTLNSSFSQIFLNECQFLTPLNDDVLFEVAFPSGVSGEVGYYNGIKMVVGTSSSNPYGSASGSVVMTPTYYYSFDTLDSRLPATCAVYSLDANLYQTIAKPNGGITTGKWCKAWMTTAQGYSSTKATGINWPLMRYSDVLLMLAETENELNGPTSDAKNALKLVRERAFSEDVWTEKVNNYVDSVAANHDKFFNAIVNERAWEFGGECLRKFDLVRWNLYGKKIAKAKSDWIQMGLDARETGTGNGYFSDYPNKVYWKLDSTTKTLDIVGLYRKATAPATSLGYTSTAWLTNLVNSDGSSTDFIDQAFSGYSDETGATPVRYILPIHQTVIDASLDSLKNYYNY